MSALQEAHGPRAINGRLVLRHPKDESFAPDGLELVQGVLEVDEIEDRDVIPVGFMHFLGELPAFFVFAQSKEVLG